MYATTYISQVLNASTCSTTGKKAPPDICLRHTICPLTCISNKITIPYQVTDGNDTVEDILECASFLGELASGSYGPNGKHKLIQANEGDGCSTVSSVSGRIFEGKKLLVRSINLAVLD